MTDRQALCCLGTLWLTCAACGGPDAQAGKAAKAAPESYTVAGEVVVPPGQTVQVTAPVAGSLQAEESRPPVGSRISKGQPLFRIVPLLSAERNLRADAKAELEAARTKLEQIASAPLRSDVDVVVAGPVDGVLRQLHVGHEQIVAQGAPLFEVAKLDPIWIRTPVYSGDVPLLRKGAGAEVKALNSPPTAKGRAAWPVEAPPSADPLASTSDLFSQLPNSQHRLRPGERVSVSIPMRGESECLQALWKSILYDIHGGAWVYKQVEPLVYTRQRVIVDRVSGDIACLAEEITPGTEVVTDGAAELFGTEFRDGK